MSLRVRVIGAGFAGATAARLLAEAGADVEVWERRNHLGGNAHDCLDDNGIRIHPYGPHIFHTNSKNIFHWLSRFTDWVFYEHRVKAHVDGKLITLPINIDSLESIFETEICDLHADSFLESVREKIRDVRNAEDYLHSKVGKVISDKIFRSYSEKQWGKDLSEIPIGTVARLPLRLNRDDRYFEDRYQFMPANGYARMFENLFNHPRITTRLDLKFSWNTTEEFDHLVYTGPLDEFFGFMHGKLPYRSLRFEFENFDRESFQEYPVENYPSLEVPYTRITEFKKITGQKSECTSIVREFPSIEGDPFYPVIDVASRIVLEKYRNEARKLNNVTFLGRLAEFRYYNMDQVVASALVATQRLIRSFESRDTISD